MTRMLAEMSWDDLQAWYEYAAVEPFGEERKDLRAGVVAAMIGNAHRDPKTRPFRPADFLLSPERSQKPMDRARWLEIKAAARSSVARNPKRLVEAGE